ncbi:hypothetical protein HMPREF1624_08759 [Sporothrix schenckii ATCC 58251]|uniref:NADPH-dependent FMN reductase-like domain-containing protein n=1 Tax=Sporothrix schenckii (strain ATCC 58251 / de Perez 2211183) TaxID=1391915 RepID=U7PH57_SPOS1|nr:hypothetical protein HMPREF1624_08759 [Sporothrix schenckii ATCC 58251]
MTVSKTVRVGVISGSTRVVRAGPQIAAWVRDIIEKDLKQTPAPGGVALEFETIDLGALGLPLLDEPGIPAHIGTAEGYTHEHTRAWSRQVAALDGFVFVTAQHNWGIPAGLKNAIDYLYNEWRGKPFMVVTYGGHGGVHAAAALQLVLGGGLKMLALKETVNLTYPGKDVFDKCARGQPLGLPPAGTATIWQDRQEDIAKTWRELAASLATKAEKAT